MISNLLPQGSRRKTRRSGANSVSGVRLIWKAGGPLGQGVQIVAAQRQVALVTRHKVFGHADMKLPSIWQGEPDAAACGQNGRFGHFGQLQKIAEEGAGVGLASGGGFNLNMV